MGDYIHTETQQVMSQGQWRNHYKNTSLPRTWTAATLAGLKLEPVFETPKPTVDRMQTARRNGVKKDSKNNWVWAWVVEAKTQEQLDAENVQSAQSIRSQRDNLLAASDWTQVPDAPVDQTAWRVYRQALRDITSQQGFPHEVTWPTKPE
jgi:hypothetical protein